MVQFVTQVLTQSSLMNSFSLVIMQMRQRVNTVLPFIPVFAFPLDTQTRQETKKIASWMGAILLSRFGCPRKKIETKQVHEHVLRPCKERKRVRVEHGWRRLRRGGDFSNIRQKMTDAGDGWSYCLSWMQHQHQHQCTRRSIQDSLQLLKCHSQRQQVNQQKEGRKREREGEDWTREHTRESRDRVK